MTTFLASQRFLAIYSGVLTLAFVVAVLSGFATEKSNSDFKEINVQRINIVEPDGTLRMIISNRASFPGIFLKGKEHPHPDNRKSTGILFLNDEGTENGGLTFGGAKDKEGIASSHGHLSFDDYEQDQVLSIDAHQEGEHHRTALTLVDRPSYPIGDLIAFADRIKDLPADKKKAEIDKFSQSHPKSHTRLSLGRGDDKSVAMAFKDADGRNRIIIEVAADGSPTIRFFDPNGKVISQLPPAKTE
jgi:hypothetical protein